MDFNILVILGGITGFNVLASITGLVAGDTFNIKIENQTRGLWTIINQSRGSVGIFKAGGDTITSISEDTNLFCSLTVSGNYYVITCTDTNASRINNYDVRKC